MHNGLVTTVILEKIHLRTSLTSPLKISLTRDFSAGVKN